MNNKELSEKLISQLQEISVALIKFYGLQHEKFVSNLSDPLLRWLDFRLRYVDPERRHVFMSNVFPKRFPKDARRALVKFALLNLTGCDINPYQGTGLTKNNDISSKKRRSRSDFLWADWGIHHFHLSTKVQNDKKYYAPRSDWLVFCAIYKNAIFIIDVRSHKEANFFSDIQLLKSFESSWPHLMSDYELKGIIPSDINLSKEDISKSRKGGLVMPITINGKAYTPPGMGITTASTPGIVTDIETKILRCIYLIAEAICSDDNPLKKEIEKHKIQNEDIEFSLSPKGLIIYSGKANCGWLLKDHPESAYSFVREMMTPGWVVSHLQYRIENPLLAY
ncbi:hypothetical protein [Vreelandella boliviensis]|uniref:Uncharacterized protein n=1 Tax=Vreelandella boliviensis LC1 TaxID=1072583 RepID=A0A265DTI3_9GAMM|nr:hypothetical protein [Halomonas boliviensis]EHJ91096.1 hypothetical protein KUC_3920 [Halomonas boliviensis LC1]OZT72570.1 hypothetical protein CE457_18740 [Halomonas boliviensis LC1]